MIFMVCGKYPPCCRKVWCVTRLPLVTRLFLLSAQVGISVTRIYIYRSAVRCSRPVIIMDCKRGFRRRQVIFENCQRYTIRMLSKTHYFYSWYAINTSVIFTPSLRIKSIYKSIQTQKGPKQRLFIMTQTYNLHIYGAIPFVESQNDT